MVFISSFQKAVGWGVYSSPTALYYCSCCSLTILAVRSGIQPKTRLVIWGSLKMTEPQPYNTILPAPLYSAKENRTEHPCRGNKKQAVMGCMKHSLFIKQKEDTKSMYFSPKTPVSKWQDSFGALMCHKVSSANMPLSLLTPQATTLRPVSQGKGESCQSPLGASTGNSSGAGSCLCCPHSSSLLLNGPKDAFELKRQCSYILS